MFRPEGKKGERDDSDQLVIAAEEGAAPTAPVLREVLELANAEQHQPDPPLPGHAQIYFPFLGTPTLPTYSPPLYVLFGPVDCSLIILFNSKYPLISDYIPSLSFWVCVSSLRMIFFF